MRKRFGSSNSSLGRRGPMERAEAEETGVAALAFLAEEPGRLGRFLSLSGLAPGDLVTQAGEAHMLAAILAHVLADESLLLVFAAEKRVDPERVAPAQALLEGGAFYDEG